MPSEESGVRVCYVPGGLCGHSRSGPPMEVHVKDGRIVRVLPFRIPDEVRLYRIRTSRGEFTRPRRAVPAAYVLAWRKRVESPSRLRYPLKRVDWSPENRSPQNRGKSGYVRVSWDEAVEIIVNEIKRVKEVYGTTEAILVQADGHGQSGLLHTFHCYGHYLFDKLGGYTAQIRNPDSWEGYYWGAKHVWGFDAQVGEPIQDAIFDDILENCEMLIFSGCDPESTVPGFAGQIGTIMCRWVKQAGIKIVGISPDLNYAEAVHADKWIPIRPNTDAALYLAVAYTWIKEDTYDKRFVQTHCHGFEEFKKYVLGEEDGVAKTPEWAERVCGVSVETIKALARAWVKKRTSLAVFFGGPKIRGPYSSEVARIEAIVLSMQGLGKPGRQFFRFWYRLGLGCKKVAPLPRYPEVDAEGTPSNFVEPYAYMPPTTRSFIIKTLVPEAILNPPVSWYCAGSIICPREDQFTKYTFPPAKDHPGIRMIWNENACWTACWSYGYKMIEALRSPKIDFVVGIHPWFENDLRYADLILPAQTVFEHEDIIAVNHTDIVGLLYQDRCIEPVGESRSDYEIHRLIAEKLGLGEAFPPPEEALRKAFEKTLAAKMMSWEEFKRRKVVIYDCPTPEEWEEIKRKYNVKPGLTWYYELPEGRGLETPTGKLEFYSTGLAEHFPDDKERPPLPRYLPHGEAHQESLEHIRAEKYPLLLMSNHPRWRLHAQGDDISWTREIPTCKVKGSDGYLYEPLWIHPVDAEKRGIKHGDVVKVFNERGAVLGGAYVTERIMPGVVYMDHGANHDPLSIEGRLDRGGCINLIAPPPHEKRVAGMEVRVPEMCSSGYLVEVEKVDLKGLRVG
jgi:anaerobic selenocysteine-containing dehydrogenase